MTNTGVCPSCGCSQPQGLLCSEDTGKLEAMLAAAPQLIDQLEVAISKQAKVGGGAGKAGKGSAHERSPINWGAVAVRDALRIQVLLWTDINAVRRDPKAADILSGVGLCIKNAFRAIDRMQDRQYLGVCLFTEDDLTCHAEVWARPGAHQVSCTQCGITHDVFERRKAMLDKAEDMLCTVREASQYIGSYGDLMVSESTIRSYISKGQIVYHGKVGGSSVIRLGDLLLIVGAQAAKPKGRQLRKAS